METATERQLVRRALDGDCRAFDRLVETYQGAMFNTAYRMLGDREDAQDVTQSTFVKAWEKLGTYDSKHRFFSWIYRILVNESLNLVGKRRRHAPLPEDLQTDARSPEDDAHRRSLARRIQTALDQLTPDYRTVIVLKYFGGLSYREMGETLEIPEKTVKSRLYTARSRLADILGRQGVTT